MPNLVGIWNPQLTKDEVTSVLTKQLDRVRVPNIKYEEYINAQAGFGVALQDHGILENGPQPAHTDDGHYSLMFDGEVLIGVSMKLSLTEPLNDA